MDTELYKFTMGRGYFMVALCLVRRVCMSANFFIISYGWSGEGKSFPRGECPQFLSHSPLAFYFEQVSRLWLTLKSLLHSETLVIK